MENLTRPRNVVQISKGKFIIAVVLALGIVGFFVSRPQQIRNPEFGVSTGMYRGPSVDSVEPQSVPVPSATNENVSGAGSAPAMMYDRSYPDYYPYPYSTPKTIEDTREFLKVSYAAEIKTRDVSYTVSHVRNIVEGVDGRIDNINTSQKYGSISFVVPKSSLYEFQQQIESSTNKKLIVESISSENLLGEKQSIEQQTETLNATLARLAAEKSALTTQHAVRLAAINKDLAATEAQLVIVREKISKEKSKTALADLKKQESALVATETSLMQSRDRENTSYAYESARIQNEIQNANDGLTQVKKQDVQFGNTVETVSGTISVRWVTLWDMAKTVSPIHPSIIIALLVLMLWRYLYKRGTIPAFQLV